MNIVFLLGIIRANWEKNNIDCYLVCHTPLSETGSALSTDLSFFALRIMGFSRFRLTMADKKIKVHRRAIRMIFSMIQRAEDDRSVLRALPVYDNVSYTHCWFQAWHF